MSCGFDKKPNHSSGWRGDLAVNVYFLQQSSSSSSLLTLMMTCTGSHLKGKEAGWMLCIICSLCNWSPEQVFAWCKPAEVTFTRTDINLCNVEKLCQNIEHSVQSVNKFPKGVLTDKWFPSCFTLNSAANRAGLIICANKRDASLSPSILRLCPSLLPPLSPCWLYLTVPPSHRQRWQSVSSLLTESHPSPTDGPDHSRSRYETREEIRHKSPLYLQLIFQLSDGRVCGIS